MEIVFRTILLLSGIINFLPSLIVFFPAKIKGAYGISANEPNLELLLRHRAVFFGMIGFLMMYAAITKKHLDISTILGLVSMFSFMGLYLLYPQSINSELSKVFWIDVIAGLLLLITYVAYRFF
jgi:hypothetical protein